jgi:hypothetical protein
VVTNLTGTASININGTVGATTASTGAFTTLTTSSTVTHNGGTANGVAFLDASKVLTTGSALTFDGNALEVSTAGSTRLNLVSSSTTAGAGPGIFMSNGGVIGRSGRWLGDTSNNLLLASRTTSSVDGDIVFSLGDSYTEAMRLTSTGLGIGTSSPSSKLDVRGSATNFDGLRIINTESSSGTQTTSSLRIGITNSIGIRNTKIQAIEENTDSNSVSMAFFVNNANALDSEFEAGRFDPSGNLLVGTTSAGTMSGGSVIGVGARGGIIANSAGAVADGGTLDIAINTGGGAYQGFLAVANTAEGGAASRTQTTFSVFGRGTDSSIQQIATDNGTTGAATFTVTTPSDGVIRVTNTSGNTTTIAIQFFGGTSF